MKQTIARMSWLPHAVALGTVAALGCAGGASCPPDRACGSATWLPSSGGAAPEGSMVLAPATEAAGIPAVAPNSQSEHLPVGPTPVVLRFDLAPMSAAGAVERAILALAPHHTWPTADRAIRIVARGVLGSWTTQSVAAQGTPALSPAPSAEAVVPGRSRGPVRLDVTALIRAWQSGAVPPGAIALSTDTGGVIFTGVGAIEPADRPRLEVVLR